MTKFYHVSPDLNHPGVFTPRIPEFRRDDEDEHIPRVCVSTSIEGALTSIPNGGSMLDTLLDDTHGYLKLFVIDTDELGIDRADIIDATTLYTGNLVEDAEHTNEAWITTPFTVPENRQEIILPFDWDEESIDIVPHHLYELAEREYNGDIEDVYANVYDTVIPVGSKIVGLTYATTKLTKGQVLTLTFDQGYRLDEWSAVLHEHHPDNQPPISVCEKDDQLVLTANADCDIAPYVKKLQENELT